jgi:sugar transferase (PEP-CTERM/EpsH1 system associated)
MSPSSKSSQPNSPAQGAQPGATPVHFRHPSEELSVLYISHCLPHPPDKGDRIRAYHQIRALSRRHRVHLLAMCDDPSPRLGALSQMCERVEVFPLSRTAGSLKAALAAMGRRPLSLAYFESRALKARLATLAREGRFDVVVAYSSSMAPYAEMLPATPRVLDMVDVDSAKWAQYARFAALPKRPIYALEAGRLRAYEAAVSRRFERILVATANEQAQLLAFAPEAPVATIPNGVDFDFFRPLDLPKSKHPTLVFTGQMDYFANVDGVVHFAREVLPRLRERFPDLELLVVGRSPSVEVRALGDQPGVHVTGAVGDVRPFLARAWAFVAPLRIAQGVQNKVLEAMASELPVVATDRVLAGLAEGGFTAGEDLLAASDDQEMVEAVSALVADSQLRQSLAAAARQRLAAAYDWEDNLKRFEQLVEQVAAAAPARRRAQTSPGEILSA